MVQLSQAAVDDANEPTYSELYIYIERERQTLPTLQRTQYMSHHASGKFREHVSGRRSEFYEHSPRGTKFIYDQQNCKERIYCKGSCCLETKLSSVI